MLTREGLSLLKSEAPRKTDDKRQTAPLGMTQVY